MRMTLTLIAAGVVTILLSTGLGVTIIGASPTKEELIQRRTNGFVGGIGYAKDDRTQLCFAYVTSNGFWNFFAAVPCEAVPPDLLKTSQLSKD